MANAESGILSDREVADIVEDVILDSATPKEAKRKLRKVFLPTPAHVSVFPNGVRHLKVLLQPYAGGNFYTFVFMHR